MPEPALRNFTINFGPQHPVAHGVLRLVLADVSAIIGSIDIVFGEVDR